MKAKEYVLCHGSLESDADLQIVFGDNEWCRPVGKIWARVRDYFEKHSEDLIGLTMTMDSENFWRVFRSAGMSGYVYQEALEPYSRRPGLITIRVHIEESGRTELRHRDFLLGLKFCEDSPGYWSYNLWSE